MAVETSGAPQSNVNTDPIQLISMPEQVQNAFLTITPAYKSTCATDIAHTNVRDPDPAAPTADRAPVSGTHCC